ncbi:MAG TPA: EpsI family protein [Rhodocyclaceae bacterium]|nr:EpsI family protein [Rhodocyclaceae bacterium]
MSVTRVAALLAALMGAASVGAVLARPTAKVAEQGPRVDLEAMVPRRFDGWREEPQQAVRVINPQTRQLLDRLYSQILTRTYINEAGYRVMLSIAYGGDQREGMEAHKPEVCYPAQGFALMDSRPVALATPYGTIPARRLLTTLGQRREPVTYWYTVGNRSVDGGIRKKLVEMSFGLTGRIPDGLLFRVSSIDPDPVRAGRMQEDFIVRLLAAVPPGDRMRLSGLGERAGQGLLSRR